jgi:hypothetical protein
LHTDLAEGIIHGILLDDNNLSSPPGLAEFPSNIWAISIKRNNMTTLPLSALTFNFGLPTQNERELWLDLSDNAIDSLFPAMLPSSSFQYV